MSFEILNQNPMWDTEVPIKGWTKGVYVEEAAKQQLLNIARLPFIHKHIAVMPDVHLGNGATVGSVIATKNAIVPAAVGVDIGCGMMAIRTSLMASDLPDNLSAIRSRIESMVPHGRTDNGGLNDKGAWAEYILDYKAAELLSRFEMFVIKHPKLGKAFARAPYHMGTLGGGKMIASFLR